MRIKRVSSDVGDKIARAALWLLGLGVVLTIWGGVWAFYLFRNPPDRELLYFISGGILLSGLDLGVIGMLSGRIGRAARDSAKGDEDEAAQVAVVKPGQGRDS